MGDALSRAIKFCQEIPKDMDGVILAREGKQLLLGYTKHKHNGLISLPKYSFSNESSELLTPVEQKGRLGCYKRRRNVMV